MEYFALVAEMARQARALRRLVVEGAPRGFYGVLLARLLDGDGDGEGVPPPLEVLEMRFLGDVRADVLDRLVRRFRRSLRHLYLMSAAVVAGSEWKGMLAGWAAELGRLRSFLVRELKVTGMPGAGMLVFDGITEWAGSDGVPDEGTAEFASRTVNIGTEERVTGFQFACARGREGEQDAQRVLGKLAEVATVEVKQRPNEHPTDWTRPEKRLKFDIGGKLEAHSSNKLDSPDLETI